MHTSATHPPSLGVRPDLLPSSLTAPPHPGEGQRCQAEGRGRGNPGPTARLPNSPNPPCHPSTNWEGLPTPLPYDSAPTTLRTPVLDLPPMAFMAMARVVCASSEMEP